MKAWTVGNPESAMCWVTGVLLPIALLFLPAMYVVTGTIRLPRSTGSRAMGRDALVLDGLEGGMVALFFLFVCIYTHLAWFWYGKLSDQGPPTPLVLGINASLVLAVASLSAFAVATALT